MNPLSAAPLEMEAHPGQNIAIKASVKDPDGDKISLKWWLFKVGTYHGDVALTGTNKSIVKLKVPADATAGQTIHVILSATDNAPLPLTLSSRCNLYKINYYHEKKIILLFSIFSLFFMFSSNAQAVKTKPKDKPQTFDGEYLLHWPDSEATSTGIQTCHGVMKSLSGIIALWRVFRR